MPRTPEILDSRFVLLVGLFLVALIVPLAEAAPAAGPGAPDATGSGDLDPSAYGLELRSLPGDAVLAAFPPLPDPGVFPYQLVLDDDGPETAFGLVGGTARQFLWLNRFANPGAFTLEEIWVLFPGGRDVAPNDAVQLVVFNDPDGDPTTGADLRATYDVTVQAADGATFSVYPLAPRLVHDGGGDLLIGVVNRYHTTGVDPPPTEPAALDTTAGQNRSYFVLWAGDAPDPPDLSTATVIDVLDGLLSGNLMIRGFGTAPPVTVIPTLDDTVLALLAALLALAAAVVLRQRAAG